METAADLAGEINCLEHPFLKVPYEELSKSIRAMQRIVQQEISGLGDSISHLITQELPLYQHSDAMVEAVHARLDAMRATLCGARDQLKDLVKAEREIFGRCDLRLSHLMSARTSDTSAPSSSASASSSISSSSSSSSSSQPLSKEAEWRRTRLDRILIDHLLRNGQYETAEVLARDTGIEAYVNIALFRAAQEIERALERRDCGPALQWCEENAERLGKLKSTLKFKLHLQEYVQLVRAGERMQAIEYAKSRLAGCADRHLQEIQAAMSLLIFGPESPRFPKYKDMFEDERWGDLVSQFRRNNFVLNSLTAQSLLSITLQAGLAALKTPHCFEQGNKNKNCPVCQDDMNILADPLPFAHHVNSCLVCRISGAIMNEDNPPMMLPNGNVYGWNALMDLLHNTGKITCPRTHQVFGLADLKKVYVM